MQLAEAYVQLKRKRESYDIELDRSVVPGICACLSLFYAKKAYLWRSGAPARNIWRRHGNGVLCLRGWRGAATRAQNA